MILCGAGITWSIFFQILTIISTPVARPWGRWKGCVFSVWTFICSTSVTAMLCAKSCLIEPCATGTCVYFPTHFRWPLPWSCCFRYLTRCDDLHVRLGDHMSVTNSLRNKSLITVGKSTPDGNVTNELFVIVWFQKVITMTSHKRNGILNHRSLHCFSAVFRLLEILLKLHITVPLWGCEHHAMIFFSHDF